MSFFRWLLAFSLLGGCATAPAPVPPERAQVSLPPGPSTNPEPPPGGPRKLEVKSVPAQARQPAAVPRTPAAAGRVVQPATGRNPARSYVSSPAPKAPVAGSSAQAPPRPQLPSAPPAPRPYALRSPAPAPPPLAESPSPVPAPPAAEEGPIEVEVVPPPDYERALPQDPQAVLKTPQAVHFGYTYSRSLMNLVRDNQMDIGIMNVGWTTVDFWVRNKARQPVHMYLFPGMIFKPAGTTRWAPLMLKDLQEVYLAPGTYQVFRLQCYSLDRKKPLPDDHTPTPYALETQRDPRYPRALRVMQAQLERELQPNEASIIDGRTHTLTVQFALWQATSGRYDARAQLSKELGPMSSGEFAQISQAVLNGAESLVRAADRL